LAAANRLPAPSPVLPSRACNVFLHSSLLPDQSSDRFANIALPRIDAFVSLFKHEQLPLGDYYF